MTEGKQNMNASDFNPTPGEVAHLAPGIRRILAPNPSPMTFRGTNTYLVGTGEVALIDPGPAIPAHLDAIRAALAPGEQISHIFVTHSHIDHSPLAKAVSDATGAPIHAFGPSDAGRSEIMQHLAEQGKLAGGEGVDATFRPDVLLADGDCVTGQNWQLTAIWTPGHFCNHMCFSFGKALFSGDHIMGWASTMISPPDGDLTAFMSSARRLLDGNETTYYPGHGAPVEAPQERVQWLINHRKAREAEILTQLRNGLQTIPDLTARIYTETPAALHPAAARNVFAHLIDLQQQNKVTATPHLGSDAVFRLL